MEFLIAHLEMHEGEPYALPTAPDQHVEFVIQLAGENHFAVIQPTEQDALYRVFPMDQSLDMASLQSSEVKLWAGHVIGLGTVVGVGSED